ncbi:MAG: trypsin-like peptidase domain-containing protein [Halobacteriales archaeon]
MTGRERSRRAFLGTVGAVGAGLLAGCSVPVGSQVDATAAGTPPATSPYTRVYREAVDSVVLVQVTGPTFGSQGSGFVFDDAGRVLTNQHVVADAERIDLRFADGRWRRASVLGTDVYSDLAVLEVQGAGVGIPALPFVEATPPIGTEVVAIGSPYGLEGSLSVGVISGANRAIPTSGGFSIPDAVQTDAAVNPGNSGGPLVTLDGTVVGVIRSGGGENIGFAISAALVRRVTPALVEGRRYRHPYLGISLQPVTPPVAEANDLDRVAGVMVTDVVEGGPSDGVLRGVEGTELVDGIAVPVGGDVIVGIEGEPVPTPGALGQYLALETRPGRTVELTIVREGRERTVAVTLGARPPP